MRGGGGGGGESMILDGIQHGETESTKTYFLREIWNELAENKSPK